MCLAPCRVLKVRFKAEGSVPKVSAQGKQVCPGGAAEELSGAQRSLRLDSSGPLRRWVRGS